MKLYTLIMLLISVLLLGATSDADVSPPTVTDVTLAPDIINTHYPSESTRRRRIRVCLTATDGQSGVNYIAVAFWADDNTASEMISLTHQMRIWGDWHHGRYCSGELFPVESPIGGWHIVMIAVDYAGNQNHMEPGAINGESRFLNGYITFLPAIHTQ